MKWILRIVLPVLVLAVAVIGALAMIRSKPEVETRRPVVLPPLVRAADVTVQDLQLTVKSQGTVAPRTESQLVPEVSGRVIWVDPGFATGGFFEEGDELLKIDPVDFRQAVVRARADVAQKRLRLAQEEAEAQVAREEWSDIGSGDASPLTLREPQLEEARAALEAAKAALQLAERDLERTVIRAPYAGRIRTKSVDVGQFVTRGTPLATVYAVDYAEIRLPLPDRDLAYLDLPLDYRGYESTDAGPAVVIRANFAGRVHEWSGQVVRTEGEIDARSRMVHVVARVKDPYARGDDPDHPPLAVGMFVEAEIEGRRVADVAVLPRAALRTGGRVFVIDEERRIRFRDVSVLRATEESVVVRSGLEAGERVCLSPLEAVTDGMRVRVFGEEEDDRETDLATRAGRESS
jgi:RND family efflux transporter MFP subunit